MKHNYIKSMLTALLLLCSSIASAQMEVACFLLPFCRIIAPIRLILRSISFGSRGLIIVSDKKPTALHNISFEFPDMSRFIFLLRYPGEAFSIRTLLCGTITKTVPGRAVYFFRLTV